ncbi:uncharacterized protein BJX67DRAFT_129736 [Aspergillus lucknowensis]|uniref:Secreted protein n=1 Tax=Aspergillus lucknowensis TaxID=176173 RepID=A0ABR4LT06_9EURO
MGGASRGFWRCRSSDLLCLAMALWLLQKPTTVPRWCRRIQRNPDRMTCPSNDGSYIISCELRSNTLPSCRGNLRRSLDASRKNRHA